MHDRWSRNRRLRLGTVALAAVLLVIGAAPAAVQAAAAGADRPSPNETMAEVDTFGGHVGYVGDGVTTASVGAEVEKAEGMGPVGGQSRRRRGRARGDRGGRAGCTGRSAVVPDGRHRGRRRCAQRHRRAGQRPCDRAPAHPDPARSRPLGVAGRRPACRHRRRRSTPSPAPWRAPGRRSVFEFEVVPSAVYEIDARTGSTPCSPIPTVASVTLDGQVQGQLDSSTGVIDSDLLNTAGVLGDNFDGSTTGALPGGDHRLRRRRRAQRLRRPDRQSGLLRRRLLLPGWHQRLHRRTGLARSARTPTTATTAPMSAASPPARCYTGGHEGVARGARIVAIKVAQDSPTSSRWTALFSSIDARPSARDRSQDVHQPQPGLGEPEHRHQLDVLGGRPGMRRPGPDDRRPVRPAPGPGRRRGGGGGQQRRHRRDELPRMLSQRLRHRGHR